MSPRVAARPRHIASPLPSAGPKSRHQPGLVGHARAARGGDLRRAVARGGVDHQHLVDQAGALERGDGVEHRADRLGDLARGEDEADAWPSCARPARRARTRRRGGVRAASHHERRRSTASPRGARPWRRPEVVTRTASRRSIGTPCRRSARSKPSSSSAVRGLERPDPGVGGGGQRHRGARELPVLGARVRMGAGPRALQPRRRLARPALADGRRQRLLLARDRLTRPPIASAPASTARELRAPASRAPPRSRRRWWRSARPRGRARAAARRRGPSPAAARRRRPPSSERTMCSVRSARPPRGRAASVASRQRSSTSSTS